MTTSTLESGATCDPPAGFVSSTMSTGWSLSLRSTLPRTSPAPSIAARASSSVRPITDGTVTWSGSEATTRFTALPIATSVPDAGSVAVTVPGSSSLSSSGVTVPTVSPAAWSASVASSCDERRRGFLGLADDVGHADLLGTTVVVTEGEVPDDCRDREDGQRSERERSPRHPPPFGLELLLVAGLVDLLHRRRRGVSVVGRVGAERGWRDELGGRRCVVGGGDR